MRLTFSILFLFGFIGSAYPKTVANEILQGMLDNPHISIIGGNEAQSGEFPFMASLAYDFFGWRSNLCGGTLIAPSYILTAGHCFHNMESLDEYIQVDMNTLNADGGGPGSITRKVSSVIRHKNYFENDTLLLNDIALLVLNEPVTAADKIPFAQLPKDEPLTTTTSPITKTTMKMTTTSPSKTLQCTCTQTGTTNNGASLTLTCTCTPNSIKTATKKPALKEISNYSNMSAVITGWGKTADGSSSPTLLKANVTVYDNSVCKKQWGNSFDGSKQLCAGQKDTSTCNGDSGGPIFAGGNVQIGITSFGVKNCADPTHVPVFTRVSAFLDWIKEAMDNNPPPAKGK